LDMGRHTKRTKRKEKLTKWAFVEVYNFSRSS
jgi:hypothetical protein